ncbi:LytR family transcriptional regulator [Brevibacillus sp. LEMMJ03]|uniref:LCP family protein n=1 Tax=Brevibacillus sp. LEMMJ03 TaxID=2595056 RepID=UPI0011801A39|nr:LCP family protein [Brevibacillus sp. LEMMJ03]TRY24263.1 LytR family transcriptional regulator [Brevibacillus sp. LEMMJ03]
MPETVARTRASAQKKKPARRRRLRRRLFLFSLFMLLMIGGAAGAVYWKIDQTLDTVTQPQDDFAPLASNTDPTYHSDKPLSFIILGRDTRPETGTMNTDVMIVAVANPETKKVTMVSLPRDTRVKIPGYRDYHKINAVYANGEAERRQAERNNQTPTEDGISLTKKTLTELLGIPIQHYVAVDFEGFKAVIDELGGIEVNVDRKLVYDDPTDGTHINLEPGLQLLNGEQALGYVRHRHDNRGTKYFSTDFDRNRRQQEVIRAVVDKTTSLDGLTKIFKIMDVGAKHIHTDLSKEQIKGLAYDFKGFNSSSLVTLDNGAYWKGGYTYLPRENLNAIRTALQTEMGLSGSVVAQLNDSPVLESAEETVTVSSKPRKKSTTATVETAAPATPPAKPKPSAETPSKPAPVETEPQPETGATPPPDIIPPATGQEGTPSSNPVPAPATGTTPPPDIAPPGSGQQQEATTVDPSGKPISSS